MGNIETYNTDNLRTSKTVNRETTDFVWNGQNLAAEINGYNMNTYTYDNTGIHMADKDGTVISYIKDYHGSIVGTANSSGKFLQEYNEVVYEAFGNLWDGETPDNFGYSGEYRDDESGLIYLRNRYYDSRSGRFITEDPAQDGLNWYVYAANNPISFVDPWGLTITASLADKDAVLEQLQQLTDDKLDFEVITDDDGNETDTYQLVIEETYSTDRHVGQTLIHDLVDSDEVINIQIGVDKIGNTWSTDNVQLIVYINPDDVLQIGTKAAYVQNSNGDVLEEDIPDYIHLGHELVHAWRNINGMRITAVNRNGLDPYTGLSISEEELQTTGLNYTDSIGNSRRNYASYNGIISENGLRIENGLNTRISYSYVDR